MCALLDGQNFNVSSDVDGACVPHTKIVSLIYLQHWQALIFLGLDLKVFN